MRPDNPDVMFVTDSFAGVHASTDGGLTWFPSNEGIIARAGDLGDLILAFCLTIDPNDPNIIWAGMFNCQGELAQGVKFVMSIFPGPKVCLWAKIDDSQEQPDATRLGIVRGFARDMMEAVSQVKQGGNHGA